MCSRSSGAEPENRAKKEADEPCGAGLLASAPSGSHLKYRLKKNLLALSIAPDRSDFNFLKFYDINA
jgi:hypothetical protein